jgi:hypothetical protein
VTRVEQAEAIFRAVVVSFGGKPDHWQHSVEMIQRGLRAGPSDPDPGF